MVREDYIYSSMTIRMEEKKLLTKSKMLELVECNNLEKVYEILSETNYSQSILKNKNYDEFLNYEENKLKELLLSLNKSNMEIIDIFLLENKYTNLKLSKKKEFLSSNKKDFKNLKEFLIEIDKEFLNELENRTKNTNILMLENYAKKIIEKYNLLTVLRMKKENLSKKEVENALYGDVNLLLQYYENEDFDNLKKKYDKKYLVSSNIENIEKEYEKDIYDLLCSENVTYGSEVIISYYFKKITEISNLRKIISFKLNEIDSKILKDKILLK